MTVFSLIIAIVAKPLVLLAGIFFQQRVDAANSASANYLYAFVCVCCLPVIAIVGLFGGVVHIPLATGAFSQAALLDVLQTSWGMAVVSVYSVGFFIVVFYRALGIYALRVQQRHYTPAASDVQDWVNRVADTMQIKKTLRVWVSPQRHSPYVWGVTRHHLVIPSQLLALDRDGLLPLLLHELSHVKRNDWLKAQIVLLIAALFWFLPPVWWLYRRTHDLAEQACDDRVVDMCDQYPEYAELLVQLATTPNNAIHSLPASNAINGSRYYGSRYFGSRYYQRVLRLFDRYQNRETMPAREVWLTAAILTLWVTPLLAVNFTRPIHEPTSSQYIEVLIASEKIEPHSQQKVHETVRYYLPQKPLPVADVALPAAAFETQRLPQHYQEMETLAVVASPVTMDKPAISSTAGVSVQGYLPKQWFTPRYPARAIRKGVEGEVHVTFSIDAQGRVKNARVTQAEPAGYFENAVMAALVDYQFVPSYVNGEPVVVHGVAETFLFRLQSHDDAQPVANTSDIAGSSIIGASTGPPD